MTRYNGNGIYLAIDGNVVHSQFKTVNLEPSIEAVDMTRGSGTTHMMRNEGLKDTTISITLGYDTDLVPTWFTLLKPGRHTVEFGPEGNASGKPRHLQDFIFTGAPLEISVEKEEVVFDISGDGADAPTYDMYNGATF